MKKIGLFILLSIVLAGCNRTSDISNTNSGSSLSDNQIKTGNEVKSVIEKIKDKTEKIFDKEESYNQSDYTGTRYQNKKTGLSLILNPNRSFEENVGNSLITFTRDGLSGTYKASISISQLEVPEFESNVKLEDYYNQNKLSIRDVIEDFTEISQKKIKLDGNQALEVIYDGEKNGQKFQVKQIFFQKSNQVYIATYISSQEIFSLYLPEADSIIKSIKLD